MEMSQVNKDTYEVFRERLRILRKEKGYTQKEMAERLAITRGGYNNYEVG